MSIWGMPRSPRWRFTLLDANLRERNLLTSVREGDMELSADSRLGGSGKITIGDTETVNWLSDRVRIFYDPGIPGVTGWAVATFMFASPTLKVDDGKQFFEVDLLPLTTIVDGYSLERRLVADKGVNIIRLVEQLLRECSVTNIAVTPSARVLTDTITFKPGDSYLTVINTLLDAVGYWGLWVDALGQFRLEPYTLPGERAVQFEFVRGKHSIHAAKWEREHDIASVPNKYIVVGHGTDEKPPLVGVATDENPNSPYSVQARGRVITKADTGVEGADQTVFDRLAAKRLIAAQSVVAKLTVSHAIVPIQLRELVLFVDTGISVRATVQRMRFRFTDDSLCEASWREVR